MSLVLDGTGDYVATASGAVSSGLDATDFCIALMIYCDSKAANNAVFFAGTDLTDANYRTVIRTVHDGVSGGFFLDLRSKWAGMDGVWITDDALSYDQWYSIAINYDRNLIGNDPIFYVNGNTVPITETSTPAGALSTGADTVKLGEYGAAAQDFDGKIQSLGWWSSILSQSNIRSISAQGPSVISANREAWWKLISDGTEEEQSADFTAFDNATYDDADALPGIIKIHRIRRPVTDFTRTEAWWRA